MKSDPFQGRYLFHLHTTYTDGLISVRQYFEYAVRKHIDRLIFLEHIRQQPSYNVQELATEISQYAQEFGVPALIGFEAKILPGGSLDICREHAELAAVIGIAEHGFPADFALWHASVQTALETCAATAGTKPVVWVHPGLWLKKQRLLDVHAREYRGLLDRAQSLGIRIEHNLRHGLLPKDLCSEVSQAHLVIGADAHRWEDVCVVTE